MGFCRTLVMRRRIFFVLHDCLEITKKDFFCEKCGEKVTKKSVVCYTRGD